MKLMLSMIKTDVLNSKKFFVKKFQIGENLNPPPVPFYRLKNQNGVFDEFYKIFVKFGLEN